MDDESGPTRTLRHDCNRRWIAPLCIGLLTLDLCCATPARAAEPPAELRGDAQLADACFAGATHVWAVGDRGTIWHSADGGTRWKLEQSGVDCRLQSVQFLDRHNGWAAGGSTQPYTYHSSGVVLRTRDGGTTWQTESTGGLPAVVRIRFFDARRGWAITQPSPLFPSSVFATDDGGRSWAALPASEQQSWLTGDFVDGYSGAVAGRAGALAAVRRRGIESIAAPGASLRAIHRLKLLPPTGGWLVGDGGLVQTTVDLGRTWQSPEGELPIAWRRQFDWYAVDAVGTHVWLAGSPGTRVVHSPDGGHSWEMHATNQHVPLRSLAFADEQHGCAVGDLGTILTTTDGGRSWRRARAGGTRAAHLGIFASPHDVPWELVARLSAGEGYLGAVQIVGRDDVEARPPAAAEQPLRTHLAAVQCGANVAQTSWQFPVRSRELKLAAEKVITDWNRATDGRAMEQLEERLTAAIRTWRPEVLVTGDTEADAQGRLVQDVVLRASRAAADPSRYAEQLEVAGLEPWQVKKAFAALPPGRTGTTNVSTAELAVGLGTTLADLAAPARGLVESRYEPVPANCGLRLLVNRLGEQPSRDVMSGITLAPGGEARRMPPHGIAAPPDLLRSAQARRNLQAILDRSAARRQDPAGLMAEVAGLTRGMAPDHAAQVLFQLAEQYRRQGRWELAAETFDLVVQRHGQDPLAGASLVWLAQYYASEEAAWRVEQRQQAVGQTVVVRADGASAVEQPPAEQPPATQVRRTRAILPGGPGSEDRPARASSLVRQLEQSQPGLAAEPAVRFALAASLRRAGANDAAERLYLDVRRERVHDAWWACAESESWIASRRGAPPQPVWRCARAAVRPRLDGKFDEPLWRAAHPVELRSTSRDDADWPAVALLAYDREFLYLAVSAKRSPGAKYDAPAGPRLRDADLPRHDRVELLLDVDRDRATYYKLSIDHRGWTADSCWGDSTWNPSWFVAAQTTDDEWTAEAAVPLSELTRQRPDEKHVWAAGIQRVVPGVGFQSWNTLAAPDPRPESFGLLLFE